jgi:hypothetical protein
MAGGSRMDSWKQREVLEGIGKRTEIMDEGWR